MKLYHYQKQASRFLQSKSRALLSLDCGLGKTASAIDAAIKIEAKSVLVLCPAVAIAMWEKELKEFNLDPNLCGWEIYSYGSLHKIPNDHGWDLIILDESHFLKSPEAKRTLQVWGKNGLCRRAERLWCLSATPMPNHPGELWPMLFTFNIAKMPYEAFINKFCRTRLINNKHTQIIGIKLDALMELRDLIARVSYRLTKEQAYELKDLPPITYDYLPLKDDNENQARFIDFLAKETTREEILRRLEAEKNIINSIREITSEHEASLPTLRRFLGVRKTKAVGEIVLQELTDDAYQKIVIFCHHKEVIQELEKFFTKNNLKSVVIDGSTLKSKRGKLVATFQNDPEYKIFIGNIQAAGTAITLTAAHQVLFVEQSWVPSDNHQASMRCHRIGQKYPVTVRIAVLDDFIDDKISQTLTRKQRDLAKLYTG